MLTAAVQGQSIQTGSTAVVLTRVKREQGPHSAQWWATDQLSNYYPGEVIRFEAREEERNKWKKRGRDWQTIHTGSFNLIRAEDRRAMGVFMCVCVWVRFCLHCCSHMDSKTWWWLKWCHSRLFLIRYSCRRCRSSRLTAHHPSLRLHLF